MQRWTIAKSIMADGISHPQPKGADQASRREKAALPTNVRMRLNTCSLISFRLHSAHRLRPFRLRICSFALLCAGRSVRTRKERICADKTSGELPVAANAGKNSRDRSESARNIRNALCVRIGLRSGDAPWTSTNRNQRLGLRFAF